MVTTGHLRLLYAWSVADVNEELDFKLYLILISWNLNSHMLPYGTAQG